MISNAYNRDCMEAMREFPDGFFDLAVVDPPYGNASVNGAGGGYSKQTDVPASDSGLIDTKKTERTGGTWAKKYGKKS